MYVCMYVVPVCSLYTGIMHHVYVMHAGVGMYACMYVVRVCSLDAGVMDYVYVERDVYDCIRMCNCVGMTLFGNVCKLTLQYIQVHVYAYFLRMHINI